MKKIGVSLIVLVITIIVILILAGIVIFAIGNSGILDKSKKAKFLNDYTSIQEIVNVYAAGKYNAATGEFELPLKGYLTDSDKSDIINNVPTLNTKIEELSGPIDTVNLAWIDSEKINATLSREKQEKGYIIDVKTGQIYDYVGDFFQNERWHTLDGGVSEVAVVPVIQDMWNGWINLTLYYPANSTAKMWRLGNEGEIRVDPMLMWQNYTGPIRVPLDRIKDVWIKYKIGNEEVTVPPAGTLLVDIVPDKTGTTKVSEVNVNINYDSDATTKEYKVGSSDWMPYTGGFTVTENCLIQARAKKTENTYNTDGSLLMSRDIAGKDLVYIGNIGVEETDLAAPVITRIAPANGDEKARIQITYPENAVKKIFKINYGLEQNYTSEVSIKSYGTYVIAYYYDVNGKKSLSTSIYINDTTSQAAEDSKAYEPLPPYVPEAPIPYEPDTKIKLPPPVITRLDASSGSEKARVQITYPANADRKIFTQNYGIEQNYVSEISVAAWGTYIMAYYYDVDGNKSQIAYIRVNEIPTAPGALEPVPINPAEIVPEPVINITPNSGFVPQVSVSVTSPADASVTYLKIGRYGTYQEYTVPVVVKDNEEVYAYYRNASGEKSLVAGEIITNILKNEDGSANNKPYVHINAKPYPWSWATKASQVTVNITSSYADKVEYSDDGIVYTPYTEPFVVTENKRIYARATNVYGVSQTYLDITNIGAIKVPNAINNLAVNINVNPEPTLATTRVAKATVTIDYDSKATEKYYSIGKYGDLKTYTGPFDVTSNCTIYAYAKSTNGRGQTSKIIDNLLIGISSPVIVSSPNNNIQASKVEINITYDKYATIKKYSIDGGVLTDYTGPFEITTNGATVYAYSENSSGEKSNASYTVENIISSPPVLVLDKENYYLLKLSYPEDSKSREYKWKVDGTWSTYKEAGILLIKPQFKDQLIKDGTLVKIEDENGKMVTFTGDYYLIDVPISELSENISMRWDRVASGAPQIVINPTEPTRQVAATIIYNPAMIKKQYRVVKPGEIAGDWQDYTGPITIDRNNTIIYAKGMDDTEVWSVEGMKKVTNIDEVPPVIKLTADTTNPKKTVGVKVDVTDDVAVELVKWSPGIQGENYFESNGNTIQNNSTVNITENGFYTFYAEDKVGNKQVYTLNVTNIDKTAPNNPAISATPTSWTNGNVTVTITYSADTAIKEYSINGTTWLTYTMPIVVSTNNTTIYARATDNSDNQSGQSTLTISNIDKALPIVAYGTNGGNDPTQVSTLVTVNDLESGIDSSTLQYVWDIQNTIVPSSGWTAFTNASTLTKTGDGVYYLWIKVNDNVGNILISKSNAFTIGEDIPASIIKEYSTTINGQQASYNNPVIPAGFMALNTPDASWSNLSTDWDKGLAIQDASGNQFVWVPVDGVSVPYAKWCTTGVAYNNASISDDTVPIEFDSGNITSIYKGFYIARYEAMFDYNGGSLRVASKKSSNKKTTDWSTTRNATYDGYLWNYISYTDAKVYSENMDNSYGYKTNLIGTNLITGAEWDTVLKWIQNSGKSVTDSRSWGNYNDSIAPANVTGYKSLQPSGYSNYWKAKNIYDLAGNTSELSNEKFTTSCIIRGAAYNVNAISTSAAYRNNYPATIGSATLTFRTALYIIPMANPIISVTPSIGWTNGNVTVTVNYPSDAITKEYSLDGSNWYSYTNPVIVDANTTVYTRAFDAGIQTSQSSISITNIDKESPVIVFGTNGGSDSTIRTTVNVSDPGVSGLNTGTLQYVWDTQNVATPVSGWNTFTNASILAKIESGTYYLWIKATDRAGNTAIIASNQFVSGENNEIASTVQTVNTTLSGAITGFSYNNPVIPAGFVAVNTPDASWSNLSTDWDKGLVIQDASGNQFVWVPVDGVNVLYEKWCTTFLAYNNNNIYDDTLPSGFSTTNITTKYKGFYIARYEAMFDYNGGSLRAASKKSLNKTATNWSTTRNATYNGYLWNWINYTDAKSYSENMDTSYGYNTTIIGTNLIDGTEWDTLMKWIQNSGSSVTDSGSWGNYKDSMTPANIPGFGQIQISGYSNNWKVKNIYDIAGNLADWTNEKYSSDARVFRGGAYNTPKTQAAAAIRWYTMNTDVRDWLTFRIALYIK